MKTGKLLLVLVVAQALTLLAVLFQPRENAAMAQGVPDQGAQLQTLIDQTKAMNAKMDRLISILEGGKLQVSVKNAEDKPAR